MYHINKIRMSNWGMFPGKKLMELPVQQNLDQPNRSITEDPVTAFIGANNTGKTMVLSSLDMAVNCLKYAVDEDITDTDSAVATDAVDEDITDTASAVATDAVDEEITDTDSEVARDAVDEDITDTDSTVATDAADEDFTDTADANAQSSSLTSVLDSHKTIKEPWPFMNKVDTIAESFFSAQMTGEAIFGLYSPHVRDTWNWKKDDGPEPCVCFLIYKRQLYLVRHTDAGCLMIDTDLQEESKDFERIAGFNSDWDKGAKITKNFRDIVGCVLPWCVVHEMLINDIYSGRFVQDNIEEMRPKSPGRMVAETTNQEFLQSDIPSGHKFLGYIKHAIKRMTARSPPKTCLVLEEPTRCMHPAMIRELMLTLIDTCRQSNIQVIMSTHAPTAVEYLPLSHIFLFSRPKNTHAEVRCVLPLGEELLYPRRLFLPCLFARNCILVEGPSDQRIIERTLSMKLNENINEMTLCLDVDDDGTDKAKEQKLDKIKFRNFLRDSVVVAANGKTNLPDFCKNLVRLSIPYFIICDGDTIFGGGAKSMSNMKTWDLKTRGRNTFLKILNAKKCLCPFKLKKKEQPQALACDGVSKPNDVPENADDMWRIAEEHGLFCISDKGNYDLESWLGLTSKPCEGERFTEISDSKLTNIVKSLKTDRLFEFMEKFAKRLSTDKSPDIITPSDEAL